MTSLRVITLAGDPDREARVAAALGSDASVDLLMRCMDRMELLAAMRGGGIDAIVSVGAPVWFDAASAEEAARSGIRVVGVVADPLEADRLASLGASLLPGEAGVEEIVARCESATEVTIEKRPSSQPDSPRGRLIAVWGPKGAPGRTSIAMELAAEAAAGDTDVLLIDGDPYGGDLLQAFGIVEEMPTVVWAAAQAAKNELDAAFLELDLRRTGDGGPVLLPGVPRAELWPDVSERGWRELLTVAKAGFHTTVCDVGFSLERTTQGYETGNGRNRMTLTAIAEADRVVAVCKCDPVGIKNFLWAFEDLKRLVDLDRIRIVANRVDRGDEKEIGALFRKHLGKRPCAYVLDEPGAFHRALQTGKSVRELGPGGSVPTAMRAVCASLGAPSERRGFLTKLAGAR